MKHRLFLAAFWAYAGLIGTWLLLGLAATLAGNYPGLHADALDLSRADGVPGPLRALAAGIAAPGEADAADEPGARAILDYLFSLVTLGLGFLLVQLRGRQVVVRLLAVGLVGSAGAFNLSAHRALGTVQAATGYDLELWHIFLLHVVAGVCYVYALLLFPDGRFGPRPRYSNGRLRWPVGIAQALAGNFVLFYLTVSTGIAHTATFVIFYGVLTPLVGIVVQRRRLRRARSAEERQQSRVLLGTLVFAVGAAVGLALLTLLLTAVRLPGFAPTSPEAVLFGVFRAVSLVVPVAVIVGVTRYRLWDIDRLFSRALRYGVLAVFVTAAYTASVLAVSAILGRRAEAGALVPLLATSVVAVAFQPIRERVNRGADRLVYGRRQSPEQLMSELTRRVADEPLSGDVLALLAESVGTGLRANRCRIEVHTVEGEDARCWPAGSGAVVAGWEVTVPVVHLGETVGAISIAKAAGERFGATESSVLDDIGRQAGPALATLRLDADLRRRLDETTLLAVRLKSSCRRIVEASARERHRLERDIHDGAQQQLLSLRLELGALEQIADIHDDAALDAVSARLRKAQQSLRELAWGICPPVLAEGGLRAALDAAVEAQAGDVTVHSTGLGEVRFSRQIETAAYFCCLEALTNCARHAAGAPVRVELRLDGGELVLEVHDDGPGFDPARDCTGTGLTGMGERLAQVGARLEITSSYGQGTTVRARLPAKVLSSTAR